VPELEDVLAQALLALEQSWMSVPVILLPPLAPRSETVTISGHINEAPDLFAEQYPFPRVAEGDLVAMLSVGGYCQAAASRHCLRPQAAAVYLRDRLPG